MEPRFLEPGTNKLIMATQSYLLRTLHHNILIDTCVGNDKERRFSPLGLAKAAQNSWITSMPPGYMSMILILSFAPICMRITLVGILGSWRVLGTDLP